MAVNPNLDPSIKRKGIVKRLEKAGQGDSSYAQILRRSEENERLRLQAMFASKNFSDTGKITAPVGPGQTRQPHENEGPQTAAYRKEVEAYEQKIRDIAKRNPGRDLTALYAQLQGKYAKLRHIENQERPAPAHTISSTSPEMREAVRETEAQQDAERASHRFSTEYSSIPEIISHLASSQQQVIGDASSAAWDALQQYGMDLAGGGGESPLSTKNSEFVRNVVPAAGNLAAAAVSPIGMLDLLGMGSDTAQAISKKGLVGGLREQIGGMLPNAQDTPGEKVAKGLNLAMLSLGGYHAIREAHALGRIPGTRLSKVRGVLKSAGLDSSETEAVMSHVGKIVAGEGNPVPEGNDVQVRKDAMGFPFTEKRMAPQELHVDPSLQFKKSEVTDAENQVGGKLKGASVYDQGTAGPLTTWKNEEDGKTYVVNGHHRRELALRTGEKDVPVREYSSRDMDANQARALGALQNLRDGQGTPLDFATTLKQLGLSGDQLRTIGIPMTSSIVRDTGGLMKLSDPAMEFVRSEGVPDTVAAEIGNAGLDERRQMAALNDAKRVGIHTRDEAIELGALAKLHEPVVRNGAEGNLFGEFDETTALGERAKLSAAVIKKLKGNQRLYDQVKNGLKAGGTNIDIPAQEQAAMVNEVARNTLAYDPAVSKALHEEALKYAQSPTPKTLREGTDAVYNAALDGAERKLGELSKRKSAGNRSSGNTGSEFGPGRVAGAPEPGSGVPVGAGGVSTPTGNTAPSAGEVGASASGTSEGPSRNPPGRVSKAKRPSGKPTSGELKASAIAPEESKVSTQAESTPSRVEAETQIKKSGPLTAVQNVIAPQKRSVASKVAYAQLRETLGKISHENEAASKEVLPYRTYIKSLGDRAWSAVSRTERSGEKGLLPPKVQKFFGDLSKWNEYNLGRMQKRGILEDGLNNYLLQHMWEDPDKAKQVFGNPGKSLPGSKRFTRHRFFESMRDGIKAGLKPLYDNPVDMGLATIHAQNKYIEYHDLIKGWKSNGIMRRVMDGKEAPAGYVPIPIEALREIYGPRALEMHEAVDKGLLDSIKQAASSLGTEFERKLMRGKTVAKYNPELDKIVHGYFTPVELATHELGHAIDEKYGLGKHMFKEANSSSGLADLAAQRYRHIPPQEPALAKFMKYAHQPEEEIANMVHAYVHAPELFKQIAPEAYDRLRLWLNRRPKVKAALEGIKPSVTMEYERRELPIYGRHLVGKWYVPEEVGQLLHNFTSKGIPGMGTGLEVNNLMNASELGLSGFHGIATGIASGASVANDALHDIATGIKDRDIGRVAKGAVNLAATTPLPAKIPGISPAMVAEQIRGAKIRKAAKSFDWKSSPYADVVKDLRTAGARVNIPEEFSSKFTKRLTDSYFDTLRAKGLAKTLPAAKTVMSLLPSVLEQTMKPIMEQVVPNAKVAAFARERVGALRELGPNASRLEQTEALQKLWDNIDARFGQVVWDNIMTDKAYKQLAQIMFRAPAFGGGNIHMLATAGSDAVRGKLTHRLTFPLVYTLYSSLVGSMLYYYYNDKSPDTYLDTIAPRTGQKNPDGSDVRMNIPGYNSQGANAIYGSSSPVEAVVKGFTSRLSPTLEKAANIAQNKSYEGDQVYDPGDSYLQQSTDILGEILHSMEPFTLQEYQKELRTTGKADVISSFLGMRQAPKMVGASPALRLARTYINQAMPQGGRSSNQRLHSEAMGRITSMLASGNPKGAMDEAIKNRVAKGTMSKMAQETKLSPLARAVSSDHMTLEHALRVWERADRDEKGQIAGEMMRKVKAFYNREGFTPDDARKLIDKFRGFLR